MKTNLFRKWTFLFGLCTAIGLFLFSTILAEHRLDREPLRFEYPLINELTGAYAAFLLLPILLMVMRRFPINRNTWYTAIPIHLGMTILFGLAHTSLMNLSRIFLYDLFNLKPYQTGDLFYRYFMEYHKQFLIYCFIFAGHTGLLYYQTAREKERQTAELELNAEQLKSRLTQARLQSLKGQLQPHFLFNTLNMISSLMYQDAKKADKMISRLSNLLRLSLENSESYKIPLRQEIETIRLYTEIMKARFEDRLSVSVDVHDSVSEALVPGFLLQPLVENAIKHGQTEKEDRTVVEVTARPDQENLILAVSDNGPGLRQDVKEALSKGVGLTNTKERLKQLYADRSAIEFLSRATDGLCVTIRLPLEFATQKARSKAKAS